MGISHLLHIIKSEAAKQIAAFKPKPTVQNAFCIKSTVRKQQHLQYFFQMIRKVL